jgi:hypothetical protein
MGFDRFFMMTAQQHHSPDPAQWSFYKRKVIRAGDDGRSKDREEKAGISW